MASTQGNEWECPWKELRSGRYRWRRNRMYEHQLGWLKKSFWLQGQYIVVGIPNATPVGVDSGQV